MRYIAVHRGSASRPSPPQKLEAKKIDQTHRYADLSLKDEDLIAGGRHILVADKMQPKAGEAYLEAAAHFAAESSTGTNVEVTTTDDFTKGVDALVYLIDEATQDLRIAYPLEAGPAPGAVCPCSVPVLARRRLHQERRTAG